MPRTLEAVRDRRSPAWSMDMRAWPAPCHIRACGRRGPSTACCHKKDSAAYARSSRSGSVPCSREPCLGAPKSLVLAHIQDVARLRPRMTVLRPCGEGEHKVGHACRNMQARLGRQARPIFAHLDTKKGQGQDGRDQALCTAKPWLFEDCLRACAGCTARGRIRHTRVDRRRRGRWTARQTTRRSRPAFGAPGTCARVDVHGRGEECARRRS